MSPDQLTVIIVVNDKRRSSPWQYNGDGTLSGTVDDYHFRIGAYYLDENSRSKRANHLLSVRDRFQCQRNPAESLHA